MSDLLVLTTHAIQYQAPLFQHLAQRAGVDLHVAFMKPPQPEQPMWDQDFGRFISWDIPLTDGYRWSALGSGGLAKRLSDFARLHRKLGGPPVLIFSWSTPLHWLIWSWAIASGIPVLVLADSNRHFYESGRRPIWRHLWLKQLLHRTAVLLCVGARNRDFYHWMGAEDRQLVPCPHSVDNERFATAHEQFAGMRDQLLNALNLDPRLPTFLFAGKLISKKRPDVLLRAVAAGELRGQVNVLFAGDGILRGELGALAAELGINNVGFLGFLNQTEMPIAYALGDCLCLLSDTPAETWGLAVNEAMACGRPAIVSDACGCVPDLIERKGTGWIVSPGDVAETAKVVRAAVSQLEDWPNIGRRAREVVSSHSFANMSKGIVAALEEASGSK